LQSLEGDSGTVQGWEKEGNYILVSEKETKKRIQYTS
jgi:hypothetical protein